MAAKNLNRLHQNEYIALYEWLRKNKARFDAEGATIHDAAREATEFLGREVNDTNIAKLMGKRQDAMIKHTWAIRREAPAPRANETNGGLAEIRISDLETRLTQVAEDLQAKIDDLDSVLETMYERVEALGSKDKEHIRNHGLATNQVKAVARALNVLARSMDGENQQVRQAAENCVKMIHGIVRAN